VDEVAVLLGVLVQRLGQFVVEEESKDPDVFFVFKSLGFAVLGVVSVDESYIEHAGLVALPGVRVDGNCRDLQYLLGNIARFLLQLPESVGLVIIVIEKSGREFDAEVPSGRPEVGNEHNLRFLPFAPDDGDDLNPIHDRSLLLAAGSVASLVVLNDLITDRIGYMRNSKPLLLKDGFFRNNPAGFF
jgi:hypothetical protein